MTDLTQNTLFKNINSKHVPLLSKCYWSNRLTSFLITRVKEKNIRKIVLSMLKLIWN